MLNKDIQAIISTGKRSPHHRLTTLTMYEKSPQEMSKVRSRFAYFSPQRNMPNVTQSSVVKRNSFFASNVQRLSYE